MNYELYEGDCLTLFNSVADKSVNLAAVDFPYMGVVDAGWDNQWKTRGDFLHWIGLCCDQVKRVLTDNGSFYAFASPQMAWYVEGVIRERFNVLCNIRWQKPPYATKAEMFDKESMRSPFPASETIIFAEQGGSDAIADQIAGFTEAETQLKRRIFGDYLVTEFQRAGIGRKKIAALFPSSSGGLTGCVSNWVIGYNVPTPEQYQQMRDYLNSVNGHSDYLSQQYEELRRPFNATPDAPYTDVWTFPTVSAYPGKHAAEKPLALMKHIVSLSSRPGDTVLDCCMGYGTTGCAAGLLGRKFIGMELDSRNFAEASSRIAAAYGDWGNARRRVVAAASDMAGLPLFA